ncbi:MAG: hypothetical protein ABR577_05610 [Pyrinomonadaceae bacterium]
MFPSEIIQTAADDPESDVERTVVLINPYRDWSTNDHEAVISARLQSLGYRVVYVTCTGDLAACDRFWFNAYQRRRSAHDCLDCQNWCQRQESKITGTRVGLKEFLTDEDRQAISLWAADIPMSIWTSSTFDGFPVGHWAMASVGTHLRELPVRADNWEGLSIARDTLHATATSIRAARNLIERLKPAAMVVFNGRFCSARPFLELSRAAGIPVLGHESGDRTREDCRLLPDSSVSGRGYWDKLAMLARKRSLTGEEAFAVNDWIVRRFHDPTLPIRYASTDTSTESPWPESGLRILVVPSSNDEIIEVDGWDRPGFGSLESFLAWVTACAEVEPAVSVVVRAHPNLALDFAWGPSAAGLSLYQRLAQSAPPNVRVIHAGEKESTYSYLRGADLVVSDFSLMALEAAALGLPSIAVGRARYWQAGCVATVENKVRPWSELVSHARSFVSDDTIARARRCMWNHFFGAEFPLDTNADQLRRQDLGDAVERWTKDGSFWWDDYANLMDDAAPQPDETVDLRPAIESSRSTFALVSEAEKENLLRHTITGASRRIKRAARVLVRG